MLCALRGLPASDNGSCDLGKALLNISFDWRKLGGQLKLASQVVYCSCSFSQKMNYDISASEYNLDKCHCAILETGSRDGQMFVPLSGKLVNWPNSGSQCPKAGRSLQQHGRVGDFGFNRSSLESRFYTYH